MTDLSQRPGYPHPIICDERFPKAQRLLKPRLFARVRRQGARSVSGALVVLVVQGAQAWTRVGITVSRKVGNAVVRNKVKRRLREVFRRNRDHLPVGYDLVWIARREAADRTLSDLSIEAVEGSRRALLRLERSANHVSSQSRR